MNIADDPEKFRQELERKYEDAMVEVLTTGVYSDEYATVDYRPTGLVAWQDATAEQILNDIREAKKKFLEQWS